MSALVDNLNKLKSLLAMENPELAAIVDEATGVIHQFEELEEPLSKWRDTLEAIASGLSTSPVLDAGDALTLMRNKEKELGIAQGE